MSTKTDRPDWDTYFLGLLDPLRARAECRRSLVSCVLVRDHRIVCTGYNGAEAGALSCLDGVCPRGLLSYEEVAALTSYTEGPGTCIGIHAEDNAVRDGLSRGLVLSGCTAYVSREPCTDCRALLARVGVVRAVWPGGEVWL